MPSLTETKRLIGEINQQVGPETLGFKADFEPTVERLGEIGKLSMQKTGGMDAQRRPMSG